MFTGSFMRCSAVAASTDLISKPFVSSGCSLVVDLLLFFQLVAWTTPRLISYRLLLW